MHCTSVREHLNSLADGERLNRLDLYPRIGGHLLGCAACRTLLRRLRRQRNLSRNLPALSPPDALKARVIDGLPAALPRWKEPREGRRIVTARFAGVIAITAALAATMLLFVHPPRTASIAAADVGTALQNIQTWHLKGWRNQNGQKLLWEVWGRRKPFLYREQIGDRIVLDDGRERVQVIPPDTQRGRPEGIVLRTVSLPEPGNSPWLYSQMLAQWNMGFMKPWRETNDIAIFNQRATGMYSNDMVTESLYTVDKPSRLPIQYEMRRSVNGGPPVTAEILSAEYDVRIPSAAANPPPRPPDYRLYDALAAPDGSVPKDGAATLRGVTIQARPFAIDTEGNVVVGVYGWLGNDKLANNGAPFSFNVESGGPYRRGVIDAPQHYDDTGRDYAKVFMLPFDFAVKPSEGKLMLFTPLEPLKPGEALPRRLTLTLHAAISISTPVSGVQNAMSSAQVFSDDFTVHVPLPTSPSPLNIGAHLQPDWRSRIVGWTEPPLAVSLAEARAHRYLGYVDSHDGSKTMEERGFKAIEWMKKAIALSPSNDKGIRMRRGSLLQMYGFMAARYHYMGDNARASVMLRALIAETDRPPKLADTFWRKNAEKKLKEWGLH